MKGNLMVELWGFISLSKCRAYPYINTGGQTDARRNITSCAEGGAFNKKEPSLFLQFQIEPTW